MRNDSRFTPVPGKGIRQLFNPRHRHAALAAVGVQRQGVGALLKQLKRAFHRDLSPVQQRQRSRHPQRGGGAGWRWCELTGAVDHHDAVVAAIEQRRGQVLPGLKMVVVDDHQMAGVGPALLTRRLHCGHAG